MAEPASPVPDPPPELLEVVAERLLASAPAERAAALEDLVREHPAHDAALRRLWRDLAGAERLLGAGYSGVDAAAPADQPQAIGPYRVLGFVGEGAFGVVYRCAQEVPVRREVAVKVLRPGAGDRQTLARFEAERHVLATLNHPAIAQVYDAGALPDGRPYFVLEYVRGLPLTTYCDRHRLGVEARLKLFMRLCQGAQHAHARGIVHRDFKPANVLVFEQDGQPQPKIIDFGIAKALHCTAADSLHEGHRTETGRVVGTPGYMSPEQSAGHSGELDARADVFSLGVLLYELLTGELPWARFATADTDPPRPSARAAAGRDGVVASDRSLGRRKLASRLRGDLDWIVLKALSRERARRYACAQELADDLEHHLRGEPVRAGPPSFAYRSRKLVRRHRALLSAAGLVVTAILTAAWLTLGFRAEAEDRAADLRAAAARLLARARDERVAEAPRSQALREALLQDALALYDKLLAERPVESALHEGRARALETLSQVHWLVGDHVRAEAVAGEALAIAEALVERAPQDDGHRRLLADVLCDAGRAQFSQGRAEAACATFARAVDELERCHARAPVDHVRLLALALMEWSACMPYQDFAARAGALRRAAAIQEGSLREQPSTRARLDLVDVLGVLGITLTEAGELDAAGEAFRRADELLAACPDAKPAYACKVHHGAGLLAGRLGDHEASIARLQQAIAVASRWAEQEPRQPRPWQALTGLHSDLARQHWSVGDEAAAARVSRAAIAAGERLSALFPHDAVARAQLAWQCTWLCEGLLHTARRSLLAEAEDCARRAVALLATVPDTVDARAMARARWVFRHDLARVREARGGADAGEHWRAASAAMDDYAARHGVGAADAPEILSARLRLARHHLTAGEDGLAAAALAGADELLREHAALTTDSPTLAAEAQRLRALLAGRQRDDAAAAAAAAAERAFTVAPGADGALAAAEAMWTAWRVAGGGLDADRHRDRAIDVHRQALAAAREDEDASPADPRVVVPVGQARIRLAELLLARGERDAAREQLAAALPALDAVRAEAHADCFDEALFARGRELAASLR